MRFGTADVDRCGGMPVDIDATFCLVQSLAFQSKDACSSLLLSRARDINNLHGSLGCLTEM